MENLNKNKPIHILGLFHPLPNAANKTTNDMFLDDLADLLTEKIPKLSNTIIVGDFNINTEDEYNIQVYNAGIGPKPACH